jgi:hypothetical protein
MPKRNTEPRPEPPGHQGSPRADKGGPESFTVASTSRRRSMRPYGRRPSGSGAKSTTSCSKGSNWRSGSEGGVNKPVAVVGSRCRAMLARADVGAGFGAGVKKSTLLKGHITSILIPNQVLLP